MFSTVEDAEVAEHNIFALQNSRSYEGDKIQAHKATHENIRSKKK